MTASQHDYEEDIRKLMEDLTTHENTTEDEVIPPVTERKATVRLSGTPVATSLSDLPLILSDIPYEPLGADPANKGTEHDVELIMSTDDSVSETRQDDFHTDFNQDDFNEAEFIRQYVHAQISDNEAGGYDDARRASFFGRQIFRRGDSASAVLSKTLFWTVVAAFAAALIYGLYVLGVQPHIAARQEQQLVGAYDSEADGTVEEHESGYPKGMLASFRGLYDINPQVRGYIQYHAVAQEDFLQINYPVVFADDNVTYRNKNFYGDASSDGALYIDERCGEEDAPLTIIHGKNAANGKMFAGLNSLVGSVYSARAASRFTYNTLFERGEYEVFAVVLTDKAATDASHFDCNRADFSSDEELDAYLDAVLARSLFDYGVNVSSSDDILVLVTGASASVAKINSGRIAVYARRIEGSATNSLIVKNEDVIMPLAWYTAQKLKPHPYYSLLSSTDTPDADTTTPSKTPTDSGATSTTASTTADGSSASNTTKTPDTTQTPNSTTPPDTTPSSNTTATERPTAPIGGGEDGVVEMDQLI